MGYAGGTKEGPTYRSLGDHSEAIQIDFDPGKISYDELLDIFWEGHSPTRRSWSTQYRAAVFSADGDQHRAAEESKRRLSERLGKEVRTAIESLGTFYPAEDYHQKYSLRGSSPLMKELAGFLPTPEAIRDSTLAARINGHLGGYGTAASVREEAEALGLDSAVTKRILEILEKSRP